MVEMVETYNCVVGLVVIVVVVGVGVVVVVVVIIAKRQLSDRRFE